MKQQPNPQRGQAVLIATILFIAASTTVVFGLGGPVIRQLNAETTARKSGTSYYVSEALMEDSVYRLKNGMSIDDSESLSIGSASASVVITDTSNGKEVTSTGNVSDLIRKIKTDLVISEGVAFNYGVQAGAGGFELGGGAAINGNVYSNGPIVGSGGADINGDAIAAASAPPTPQFVNDSPIPYTEELFFGEDNSNQDFAQSFTASDDGEVSKVGLYIRKINWPGNATVRIAPDDGGQPDNSSLTTATLQAYQIGGSYGWYEIPFSSPASIESGETYWIVIDGSNGGSSQYAIASNSAMASEKAVVGRYNNSSWSDTSPAGRDGYIQIYTGGIPSEIYGTGNYVGSIDIFGLAWADSIRNAYVSGDLWCETQTTTNGSCDDTHGSPPEGVFPISDSNVNSWKDEAEAGGTFNGDKSIGWEGEIIGPLKITGDVSVGGGGTLTVTGTLWIEGDLDVGGGGSVILDESYGSDSGIIVVDGQIDINGGTNFAGSGVEGSYPLVVTTSTCPEGCSGPAIDLSGGAGAVVLVAQNGTVSVTGGTSLKSVTGYKVEISGGADINYETGLADSNFGGGPSGGFSITSWTEIE